MADYRIKDTDMNEEVRRIGRVMRRMRPYQDEETFRKMNEAEDRFVRGRWAPVGTEAEERFVPMKDRSLRVLVCRAKNREKRREKAAGLLWIHGGGYATGVPEQDQLFADMFCTEGECVAVMPDYTRSTEAPYPAALDDCCAALEWMVDNADALGIDPDRIIVGGDSAGGGLTAAVCLRARDEGKIRIAFQMPLYPMVDDRETETSQDNDAPVWNTRSNRAGWDLYLAGYSEDDDIPYYAAPARAEDLSGMPPAVTFVGTIDPFRAETNDYVRKLRKAGIWTAFREFEGCFHGFDMLAYATRPAREAREFLKNAFSYALDNFRAENAHRKGSKVKKLFYNGKVYTGELPLMAAFSVEAGVITGVWGPDETPDAADERVDLQGSFVCAGFNDSHMHLLNFGKSLRGASLAEHTGSLGDLKDCLRQFLNDHPVSDGGWLLGRGWNQDYFSDTDRMPDRHDLDEVSADVPIMITRTCGHCVVLNSAALKAAGIDSSTKAPEGGAIGMSGGEPDGRLYENACGLASAAVPSPGMEEIKDMIREASRKANSYGITSVQTDDYRVFPDTDPSVIAEAYRELSDSGELTLRVYEQCNFDGADELRQFIGSGGFTRGSGLFREGPLKMLGDGSLGSRTARLSEPYPGTEEQGILIYTDSEMREMISLAAAQGRGAVVHAIGDGCLDQVLDAFEEVHREYPGDRRDGIIHCQVSRPDQLKRIAELGLCVYAQSVFLDYDNHIVGALVPECAASSSYSWKTLLDLGVSVSNGSDCPVELPDVLKGIRCAVTRTSMDGTGPYLPGEAFSVKEALDSFTSAGAYASFEEDSKGRIAPGMCADFTVLDRDPFSVRPEEITDINVESTWLAGRRVF